nr:cytochrome b/b6 domain-containing protein [Escherichia coli]
MRSNILKSICSWTIFGNSVFLMLHGFNVSPFVTPNSEIKALIKNIHETWANIGYFLIAAHAGAALFHHYIQKDNTLLRMMPRRK